MLNALTKWFLDNPIAANLLMVFILIAGILSFNSLRVESFPQIPPSQLVIEVNYPGGTAKQVDEGITQRIEDAISGVSGIKNIASVSYPGFASIRVKKNTGVELSSLLEKIRNEVDAIVGFPTRAERPKIYKDAFGNLASFVMIYGDVSDNTLQQVSTRVQNALKKHREISKVTHLGKRRKELVITPKPTKLKQYGLSHAQLTDVIHEWSLAQRSGTLKTARGNIILKADNYADTLPALASIPIISTSQGTVTLGEIADVERGYESSDDVVRFNGKSAVALMVSTSQKDNLLSVSDATKKVLNDLKATLPSGVNTVIMADMAPHIDEQLNLLGTNAWQGLLIVIVLLGLFLEIRLAIWVAVGIPISLAGAMSLMGLPAFDYSINDITLFGMILVLGILVDDAVVVGESIHRAREQINDPKEAAFKGVQAVSVATVFGVLTTIAAFSPMLWIENELAQVLAGFSAVVIFALIFSLIESKFILPTHLVIHRSKPSVNKFYSLIQRAREACNKSLEWFSSRCYQPTLSLALKHKVTTLAIFIILVVAAYGATLKGTVKTVFFPEIPGRYATLTVEMDQDAASSLMRSHMLRIEDAISATNQTMTKRYGLNQDVVTKYLLSLEQSTKIEATIELSKNALANISSEELLQEWEKQTGKLEGSYSQKLTFAQEVAGATYLTMSSPSRDLAKRVTNELKQSLSSLPGVHDVADDTQTGKQQLQVTLNQRGVSLGITQRQIADVVGGAFGYIELHRLLDQSEELMVLLRLPADGKKTTQQLRETPIYTNEGNYVLLDEIAEFSFSRGPQALFRKNRDEVVSVSWRQNKSIASPSDTLAALQNTIDRLHLQHPDITISAAGEFEEMLEVQSGFKKAMLLTLLLIYILLAIPLRSYWQPFIIMSVIPFGFAGAIYGHAIMGLSVSVLSLFGMMAMTGVVINDSLVLMTRFNQLYASGMPVNKALIEAGKSRLRAIFLTTVTTVCGLLPLLSETSEQAQYLKPAAVSLVFGELFATPITLILIPVLLSFGKYKKPIPISQNSKAKNGNDGINLYNSA